MARVLVACETSGVVRHAFAARGHDVVSVDLLPAQDGVSAGRHYVGDVFDVLRMHGPWDLMIAHPPCTYLCSSGLHHNKNDWARKAKTEQALEFVWRLMRTSYAKRWCIENPVGCISTRICPPNQYIQPYQFGHDASKRTGLWLRALPCLQPSGRDFVSPRIVEQNGRTYRRWANQTDSGQNRLGPSETRWQERSRTYEGIAEAMAAQWSHLL